MKQKLIDILTSVCVPIAVNSHTNRVYRTPVWMAEALADALIDNGVKLEEKNVQS